MSDRRRWLVAVPGGGRRAGLPSAIRRCSGGRTSAQEQAARQQLSQPGNNAPVWREVRGGDSPYTEPPRCAESSLPCWCSPKARPGAQVRNGLVTVYGGWLLVAIVAVARRSITGGRGPIKLHEKPTGRQAAALRRLASAGPLGDCDQLRRAGGDGPRHPVRQARAAAGHRLHAVRVARDAGQEPAQLRRAGVRRLHDPDVPSRSSRTTFPAATT